MMTTMLTGEERLKADRWWRTPEIRRQFEAETGLTEPSTEDYDVGFIVWAAKRIKAERT